MRLSIKTKVAYSLFYAFLLPVFFVTMILGAHAEDLSTLRQEYLRLRNTDVNAERSLAWSELAESLVRAVDQNHLDPGCPQALLDAATLYEKLFDQHRGQDRLTRAIALLSRLAKEYPGVSLVDDGLIKLGDLYNFKLKNFDEARRSYLEVIYAYPDSDMLAVARARLKTLGKDTTALSDKTERRDPSVDLSVNKKNLPLILLDPGHGGEDFGAKGLGGLLEKDVTLDVAMRLKRLIDHEKLATVRLTRSRDEFVPLAERTAMANDFEADLFLSLHTNASPNGKLSGIETYYLDNTNDRSSKTLAERENADFRFADGSGDVDFIISDLIQNAKMDDSIILANIIDRALVKSFKQRIPGFRNFGAKKAPFYVLVGAHMPCALIEMFFIDNAVDGKYLGTASFRQELADALLGGVRSYLIKNGTIG